jgi:hypothetical protein
MTIIAVRMVDAAQNLSRSLLVDLEQRWRHTEGVARRAEQLIGAVPREDREILLAAAWLHDIGYSAGLRMTGFHPLDGAFHLLHHGWSPRIAGLVAHHSGARFVAAAEGLDRALRAYPDERSAVTDALCYADQTTGPDGRMLPVQARMAEMLARHGSGSAQERVHRLRGPYLLAVAERVRRRLAVPARV